MARRFITISEFHREIRAQGASDRESIAFRCPMCGTIQNARSLINAGAGDDFEGVERFLAYSCFGRWTGAGSHKNGTPPGTGCDWTLGGLFRIHELSILDDDGAMHDRFGLATVEETAELERQQAATVQDDAENIGGDDG